MLGVFGYCRPVPESGLMTAAIRLARCAAIVGRKSQFSQFEHEMSCLSGTQNRHIGSFKIWEHCLETFALAGSRTLMPQTPKP